jgi:hypothetical protein
MRDAQIGQCKACEHGREIASSRGSAFWRCERSSIDPSFPKYPRLPVLECRGFESRPRRDINGEG